MRSRPPSAVATPRNRASAVPVPAIVASTWVPCPFWSFHTPAASVVKFTPQPFLFRSSCMVGAALPTMKPVSKMPSTVPAPKKPAARM